MDKFDMFWSISEEEAARVHNNEFCTSECPICQENAKLREERESSDD